MTERYEKLLTAKELREILNISEATLKRWIAKKGCPFHQGATKKLFKYSEVVAWFEGRKVEKE